MTQHLDYPDFETLTEKPYPGGPAGFGPVSTSSLAVASVVFGVLAYLALPLVGAIVAVVTGHYALAQVRESEGRVQGRPLAKAGLALGYIQIALLAAASLILAIFLLRGGHFGGRHGVEDMAATPVPMPLPTPAGIPLVRGVKMVNEMDRADFRLIADAGLRAKPAEIVAFYNAGARAENPEFALVTTKGVSYVKDGSKTAFDFADVVDLKDDATFEDLYRSTKNQFGEGTSTVRDPDSYHAEVRHKDGNRMHIRIQPELAGVAFFEALKSARDAAGGASAK